MGVLQSIVEGTTKSIVEGTAKSFFSGSSANKKNTIINAFTRESQGYSDWRPSWLRRFGEASQVARNAKAIVTGNNPLGSVGALHNAAVDIKTTKAGQIGTAAVATAAVAASTQAILHGTSFGRQIAHGQKQIERMKERNREKRGVKELPKEPIVPKGEFAPLLGNFMKTILLENVTREKFIEQLIDGINEMEKYDNRDDKKIDISLRDIFKDLREELNNISFTKKINNFKALEKKKNESIKYLKEILSSDKPNKKGNNETSVLYDKILKFIEKNKIGNAELKEIEEIKKGINKEFPEEKNDNKDDDNVSKKFSEFVNCVRKENFLNEVHEIIKKPDFIKNKEAREELVIKLAKLGKNYLLKEESITPARVFIELNLTSFIEKINQEIKIINDRIRQALNTTININPENSNIIKKIGGIIYSHKSFEEILRTLFNLVKVNEDLNQRKLDIIEIKKLCVILSHINMLDTKNYDKEVKNNNARKLEVCSFINGLYDIYRKTAQEQMDIKEKETEELYKPKTGSVFAPTGKPPPKKIPKKINEIAVDLEIEKPASRMRIEIETLNMDELLSKFNILLKPLYEKYKGSENVRQISGIVPPSIVENSINYKFLLEIFPIFINEILKLDKALQKELMKPDFDIDIIDLFENITQLKVMIVDILQEKGKGNFTNFNKYVANLKEKHSFFKKFINSDIKWYKEDTIFLKKEKLTSKIDDKIVSLISIINKITKTYFPEHKDISRNDADLLNKLRKIVDDFNKKAESFNIKNKNNENKNNQNIIEYLQKLKRIKTIIDVLITRILPSNYNQIRYDVKSSVINEDIKENLDKYLSKNTKNGNLKNENNKSNEELKTELNQLLIEMYKKFLPKEKIPQMGNTSKEVVYLNSDLKPINTTNRVENLKPKNNANPVANLKQINTTNPEDKTVNPGSNIKQEVKTFNPINTTNPEVKTFNPINTTNPVANIKQINTTNQGRNLGISTGGSRKKINK